MRRWNGWTEPKPGRSSVVSGKAIRFWIARLLLRSAEALSPEAVDDPLAQETRHAALDLPVPESSTSPVVSLFEQPGPPAHWLERVRQSAPELLEAKDRAVTVNDAPSFANEALPSHAIASNPAPDIPSRRTPLPSPSQALHPRVPLSHQSSPLSRRSVAAQNRQPSVQPSQSFAPKSAAAPVPQSFTPAPAFVPDASSPKLHHQSTADGPHRPAKTTAQSSAAQAQRSSGDRPLRRVPGFRVLPHDDLTQTSSIPASSSPSPASRSTDAVAPRSVARQDQRSHKQSPSLMAAPEPQAVRAASLVSPVDPGYATACSYNLADTWVAQEPRSSSSQPCPEVPPFPLLPSALVKPGSTAAAFPFFDGRRGKDTSSQSATPESSTTVRTDFDPWPELPEQPSPPSDTSAHVIAEADHWRAVLSEQRGDR